MVTIRSTYHSIPVHMAYGDSVWPWDSIIGGIASLWGASKAAKASKYAADKQLQATRETNAANAALAKQQNDWNLEQWQRETAWDSTSSQLERWQEAGLSPNSFTGVASPVQAPNLQSADLANQQVPDLSALQGVGPALQSGIQDGLNAYLASRRLDAEVRKINQDVVESESRVKVNDASMREIDSRIKLNDQQRKVMRQTIAESKVKIEDFRSQIRARAVTTQSEQLNVAYLRHTFNSRVSLAQFEAMLKKAGVELTRAQAANAREEYYNIVANYVLKANEIDMLPFTNWALKVEAQSKAYEGAEESTKSTLFTRLYDSGISLLDYLSGGLNGKNERRSARDARIDSMKRRFGRQSFGSHQNPQIVMP